jgi:dTDP-glucose 4,6-dehydratase
MDHAVAIDLVFTANHETTTGGFNEWKNIDLVKLLINKWIVN